MVILQTLWGALSVKQGYERLGVGRTRFQDMRRRLIESARASQEERPGGRPRNEKRVEDPERSALAERVRDLEHELRLLRAELDIARGGASAAVERRLAWRGGRR